MTLYTNTTKHMVSGGLRSEVDKDGNALPLPEGEKGYVRIPAGASIELNARWEKRFKSILGTHLKTSKQIDAERKAEAERQAEAARRQAEGDSKSGADIEKLADSMREKIEAAEAAQASFEKAKADLEAEAAKAKAGSKG